MSTEPIAPPAGVRSRLLEAADRLFYAEGIHAVGIDRVLAEAGVAKASLYRHFGSKDDLVVAYLDARSAAFEASQRARLQSVAGAARVRVGAIFEAIWESAAHSTFHGCPFINAAAEYPADNHPVRQSVSRHRERFAALIGEQLPQHGSSPDDSLNHAHVTAIVLAYDGAMISAHVDSPQSARHGIETILDGLLGPVPSPSR